MTRMRQIKTSFTGGEVSRALLGRRDLVAYETGAKTLTNVLIHPTGGVRRRPGLRMIAELPGDGRLVPFIVGSDRAYGLAFTDEAVTVFLNCETVTEMDAPWRLADLAQITWTQNGRTLLVCHPDVEPRQIEAPVEADSGDWRIEPWRFRERDGLLRCPFHKFADDAVTLTPGGTSGTTTLSASEPVFSPDHVGTRLMLGGDVQAEITEVNYGRELLVDLIGELPGTDPISGWAEQAFSPARGWPVSSAFHQGRLVIGGARDLPNRVWLSRSGHLRDFDTGLSNDADAIEFTVLSDQVERVRALRAGRDLQIFTSDSEWLVSGEPITPSTARLSRQTTEGMAEYRAVPPVIVDGGTVFVSRDGGSLREFVFAEEERAYRSSDLSLLSNHLIDRPRDLAFSPVDRVLFAPMTDGTMGALTLFRPEQVTGWSRIETDGAFRSVAVAGNSVFAIVDRAGVFRLEVFDPDLHVDCGITASADEPSDHWDGLGHLEDRTVAVAADDAAHPPVTVRAGAVTLDQPARSVSIGLPFTHIVEPLPLSLLGWRANGRALRLIEVTFRVEDTRALSVDFGKGARAVPLRRADGALLDSKPDPVTADIRVRALGWMREGTKPPWRIEQDMPLSFALLAATMELKVNH